MKGNKFSGDWTNGNWADALISIEYLLLRKEKRCKEVSLLICRLPVDAK